MPHLSISSLMKHRSKSRIQEAVGALDDPFRIRQKFRRLFRLSLKALAEQDDDEDELR